MSLKEDIVSDLSKYLIEEAYMSREERQRHLNLLIDKYSEFETKEYTLDQKDLAKIKSDAKSVMAKISMPVYLKTFRVAEEDVAALCLVEATISCLNGKQVLNKLPKFIRQE